MPYSSIVEANKPRTALATSKTIDSNSSGLNFCSRAILVIAFFVASVITPLKYWDKVLVSKSPTVPTILFKKILLSLTASAKLPLLVTGIGILKLGSIMLNGINPNLASIETDLFIK